MTNRLEELFDLPNSEIENDEEPDELLHKVVDHNIGPETLSNIEKIEAALSEVKGLNSSDSELDEVANLAKKAFDELMDLGMQTDPRFSAEIFSVSSTMLSHLLSAKTAKINKKLKMIDLQLKKADLDRKIAQAKDKSEIPESTPLGEGKIIDRNELLKMLTEQVSKNNIKDK